MRDVLLCPLWLPVQTVLGKSSILPLGAVGSQAGTECLRSLRTYWPQPQPSASLLSAEAQSRDTTESPPLSSQDYTVRGLLGKATDDFREDGRLVEKTTYGESPGEPRARGGSS